MKVRSYLSEKDRDLFVILPVDKIPESLPPELKACLGNLTPFKEFELSLAQPRIGIDTRRALVEIQANGYHLSKPKFEFKVTEQT